MDGISASVASAPPQQSVVEAQSPVGGPQVALESLARVSVCSLNQWALDFDGNYRRIAESIRIARQQGAKFRVGVFGSSPIFCMFI